MSDQIVVQYVGFQSRGLAREYTFAVREVANEPLNYTVAITNDAFSSHLVRFQDAAEICSLRLRQELDSHSNHPPTTHFCVTDIELASYRNSHKSKGVQSLRKRREDSV